MATFSIWVLLKFAIPERGGWAIIDSLQMLLVLSPLAGLLTAYVLVISVERWSHWRGDYLCWQCGRTLKYRTPCACMAHLVRKPLRSRWQANLLHVQRALPRVIVAWAAAALLAYLLCEIIPHPHRKSMIKDLATAHVVLTALLGIVLHAFDIACEWLCKARRMRVRLKLDVQLLMTWPVVGAIVFACLAG